MDLCRLCASLQNAELLIQINDQSNDIGKKVLKCFRINIKIRNSMPKVVCQTCLDKLNWCYNFYSKVQDAQKKLKELFCSKKNEKRSYKVFAPNDDTPPKDTLTHTFQQCMSKEYTATSFQKQELQIKTEKANDEPEITVKPIFLVRQVDQRNENKAASRDESSTDRDDNVVSITEEVTSGDSDAYHPEEHSISVISHDDEDQWPTLEENESMDVCVSTVVKEEVVIQEQNSKFLETTKANVPVQCQKISICKIKIEETDIDDLKQGAATDRDTTFTTGNVAFITEEATSGDSDGYHPEAHSISVISQDDEDQEPTLEENESMHVCFSAIVKEEEVIQEQNSTFLETTKANVPSEFSYGDHGEDNQNTTEDLLVPQQQEQTLKQSRQKRRYKSDGLTAEERRRQNQRRNQAEYRRRKRERALLLAQQQHPIQQQQLPIEQQIQHLTQQQEPEEHQQQQHAGTAELPMPTSTSNALTGKETSRQMYTAHQEECRKRKREQEQLLAQQQNIEQQPQQQAQKQQPAETASYSNFMEHIPAHRQFRLKFMDDHFGYACVVCDRLWFCKELKSIPLVCKNLIQLEFPDLDFDNARVCSTCYLILRTNKMPMLSKTNGFKYPPLPLHLPQLDILTERLVSPRLPFVQIRRLRHGQGQYVILGQIINVPVSINNMVTVLPRNIDDDFAINVHIKKKLIHKSSYLMGLVKKNDIKVWLQYLIESPLYKLYNIKINNAFFTDESFELETTEREDLSEVIDIEESLLAQQQTLIWKEEQYLRLAPDQNDASVSILFNQHSEELSFPSIYLGEFRNFKKGLKLTPFMIASSEIRRSDRRGVTPSHLLYMAMKIIRFRVKDSITIAFKYFNTNLAISKNEVQNEDYLNDCIVKNLAFLRSIPNSIYYWSQRKCDLFAMIRQLGKPTLFLTMSANEIGWPNLIRILYKLKHNTDLQEAELQNMHFNDKATLVNEDPVTCAIYFNKIVNVIINLLQSPRYSPFGKNYVKHYFKRIEFQHIGSPHAHILLWLNEAPKDPMGANMTDAVNLIDKLVSVDASNCSGMQKLQTHKHTFACNKNKDYNRSTGPNCRFRAPFMPSKATSILIPMPLTDARRSTLHQIYLRMWKALEENDYENMDTFLAAHNVQSEETYLDILRAGITRPMVILKRKTSEKWINPFNPFILYVLRSNVDMQFITEEHSCAAYVAEYVSKSNRGISNLQQNIIKLMDEHPEFNIVEITKHLGVNFLNNVELTSQESAWYLLRQPMSQSSVQIIYIPTSLPTERERIGKANAEADQDDFDGESCDTWKENVIDKYQKRPAILENVSLAQFASRYTYHKGGWKLCYQPRVIRFRNYDVSKEQNNYKREMVTLHLAFRDEENDLLAEHKYLQLYDENYGLIMERRKEFESSFDVAKTLEICRNMCLENNDDNVQVQ